MGLGIYDLNRARATWFGHETPLKVYGNFNETVTAYYYCCSLYIFFTP